ncbi:MAG: lysophospholipid acyltransferase family protein [Chitinophagaceae bacterium]
MYYIVFGILFLISLLPLPVLYLLSYFCYFITYHVAGYRKEVVLKNLALAFPEKTAAERKEIAKQFYLNFWDNWLEALKLISLSPGGMRKRMQYDTAALESIFATGKSCHILLGHQFNWEWGNAIITLDGSYRLLAAYAPISNKIFDRLFLYIRRRFGTTLLPFNDMRRAMLPFRHQQYALALMADQSPPLPAKSYWLNFFNTPTAFLKGPEKGARLSNMPVVFLSISKPRRGFYHIETKLLTSNAAQLAEGELTQKYVQALEANIRLNPACYLWSHNRWKHQWNGDYAKAWIGKAAPAN